MTKLVINGKEYDGTAQPFIGDLRLLKKEFGFGWGTVAERLSKMGSESDLFALIDNDEFVEALLAWMWMVRLRAGERDTSIDDVRMTPLDGLLMLADDEDEQESDGEADPTRTVTPPASVPARSAAPVAASSPSTSKTSRRRSTAA